MADLIAILLVTLAGLFGTGADDETFAKLLTEAVEAKKPVPMDEVLVACEDCRVDEIGGIRFNFSELTLEPLLIHEASIDVSRLHHDERGRITMDGLDFVANIRQGDLTDALRSHVQKLSDASISIDKKGLTLSGNHQLLALKIPYSVRGTLGVENGSQLVFHIDESQLSGMQMPAGLNALIEKEVNPVYDLKAFAARSKKDIERAKSQLGYEFELQIEKISYGDGHIIVDGSA
ncbi:hypothetical protein KDL30_08555 [bacterium]|nr:hypothetical protein [bacterium]